MKLVVSTQVLQEMMVKAVKGASNNKMIPITGLLTMQVKDSVLELITTDATNTLKVMYSPVMDAEGFYVVVPVELLSKLVAKTTAKTMTFELLSDNLSVKGNGEYSIELPVDENGQLIKFPPQPESEETVSKGVISLNTVKSVLAANRASLAQTMEVPCLTGYYCGVDEVISTDSFAVCANRVGGKILPQPVLIPTEVMNLLALMDEEQINVQGHGKKIVFSTKNVIVYGTELEGIEDYPIQAIQDYLNTSFEHKCEIPRQTLLDVLDRLSLFVAPYDKNELCLTFTPNALVISSKRSNGTESINYLQSTPVKEFACRADIELLKSQVTGVSADNIELWYGHDKALKVSSGAITQIIALLHDKA